MPDFTNYSHFDANAAYASIKYGSNALVLEVELNEAQNILDNKVSTLIKDRFGDGFYKTGSSLTYATGSVTFASDKAFANGNILTISSLTLALAEGESAYLDVWAQELVYTDTVKKYGNQQETNTLTNYIQDSRVSEETTRRTQLQYNLVKTTGVSGHTYLPVCTITAGTLVDNRVSVGSIGSGGSGSVSKLYSAFTATVAGTTNVLINQPDFDKDTDVLDVYYQGAKMTPGAQYTLNVNGVSIDLTFSIEIGEVINFEVLKNMGVSPTSGMAIGYYENNATIGSALDVVTIGITQYSPTNDLLMVFANSVYLKKDVDYTVTGSGATAAINKSSGTWNSGTEFDFTVLKNTVSTPTIDGTIINAGSIPISALIDEAQNRLGVQISSYRTDQDVNGIYTTMTVRRQDGTLFSTSVLSGGTSPEYTTRTETFYDTDGTTVLSTNVYTLSYAIDGSFISEVIN